MIRLLENLRQRQELKWNLARHTKLFIDTYGYMMRERGNGIKTGGEATSILFLYCRNLKITRIKRFGLNHRQGTIMS